VFTFGQARFYGSTGNLRLNAPMIQMISSPAGRGYWLLGADGGVFSFGDAHFFGSTGNLRLNAPIIQMISTPAGRRYWLLGGDGDWILEADGRGSVFGAAAGVPRRTRPLPAGFTAVALAPTPTGRGFWLVTSNGYIEGYGDALFFGSLSGHPLAAPIVQMTAM